MHKVSLNLPMKSLLKLVSFSSLLLMLPFFVKAHDNMSPSVQSSAEHNAWLKEQFSLRHEKLIPIVAVADIFYACNQSRKVVTSNSTIKELVNKTDKTKLAENLALCLGEDTMQSDAAINFGLVGCFNVQLAHLPKEEREQKMMLVKKVILSLSREERKKSFTQCVTEQAINYL
jgi:hypothetical protein